MATWLETDSLSNQDISSALAIGAYTATADKLIIVQFFADQVAGNGDYAFYVKHQVGGSGSHYQHQPTTTATVASGVTAIAGQSGMIAVRSGDVLTVYLDGLAGDTTTVDTIVRWFDATSGVELATTQAAITWGTQTANITGNITGDLSGSVGSVTGAVGSVTGAVGSVTGAVGSVTGAVGSVTGSVGSIATGGIVAASFAAGAIDAAAIAADAIGSSELAATAVAEIADAIWDEVLAGHLTSGTTGRKLSDIDLSAVTVVSAVTASTLTIYKAATYHATVTGLTIPSGWTAMYLTVKTNVKETDANAIIQILASNPGVGTDGLQRLNAAAGTAAQGSLTVSQTNGTVAIWLADNATQNLTPATGLVWSLKALESDGDSTVVAVGTMNILGQATLTI